MPKAAGTCGLQRPDRATGHSAPARSRTLVRMMAWTSLRSPSSPIATLFYMCWGVMPSIPTNPRQTPRTWPPVSSMRCFWSISAVTRPSNSAPGTLPPPHRMARASCSCRRARCIRLRRTTVRSPNSCLTRGAWSARSDSPPMVSAWRSCAHAMITALSASIPLATIPCAGSMPACPSMSNRASRPMAAGSRSCDCHRRRMRWASSPTAPVHPGRSAWPISPTAAWPRSTAHPKARAAFSMP